MFNNKWSMLNVCETLDMFKMLKNKNMHLARTVVLLCFSSHSHKDWSFCPPMLCIMQLRGGRAHSRKNSSKDLINKRNPAVATKFDNKLDKPTRLSVEWKLLLRAKPKTSRAQVVCSPIKDAFPQTVVLLYIPLVTFWVGSPWYWWSQSLEPGPSEPKCSNKTETITNEPWRSQVSP